ncbi:S8 family serine peptidase [Amycolatopsis mongoliensis]|uniref:S8 family serine peptidase n=1 Tax=Amycolatopsis mongoliensis TaxID=715475 RepID=A0A9Y2NCQ2_9PSEU|nr:S8 family serine peptidase [Amycolatopsis sp. 4-36]WIX99851.1 S8 family serine peptidase [Amycolatopsis sp. 4-36]
MTDFRVWIGPEPFDPAEVRVPEALASATRATLVQFRASLNEPDVARLKAAYGVRLDRFVPNFSFLERLDDETAARLRADFLVRTSVPLDPALKLASWIPAGATPLDLIATLFDDADSAAVGAALSALGARNVVLTDNRAFGGSQYADFTLDDRAKLPLVAAIDEVVLVEPVPEREVTDVPAAQVFQSGVAGLNTTPIWDHELHGEGQIIGLIDKGHLDLNHCFFNDPDHANAGENHRKVLGMFDQNFPDVTEHFMFVAGILAGNSLDKNGTHEHRGGAWAAKLVCRSLDDLFPPIGLKMEGILQRGKELGAAIHTNSWGGVIPLYNTDAVGADKFSFENEEHVVIAAAANTTDRGTGNGAPGIAKNVLCVAASQGPPDQMKFGSGKPGPTADGRRKPDLMAVGNGIQSASLKRNSTALYCDTGPYFKNPELAATSWATPNAAAAAALVRQYFVEGWYPHGEKRADRRMTPSGALIRAVLLNSTTNMTGIAGYPSDVEGWGQIQLDRTLVFKEGRRRRLLVNDVRNSAGLTLHTSTSQRFFVGDDHEQLKITLVWTDPPAAESATQPTKNVLKLEARDALGIRYLGNDFDTTAGVSREGAPGTPDLLNNVQMIVVDRPFTGPWTITVSGTVVFGKQGYALVVTGA